MGNIFKKDNKLKEPKFSDYDSVIDYYKAYREYLSKKQSSKNKLKKPKESDYNSLVDYYKAYSEYARKTQASKKSAKPKKYEDDFYDDYDEYDEEFESKPLLSFDEQERIKRQEVESLFQKISNDIFIYFLDHPEKIIVYKDRLDLINDTGKTKVLYYKNYGCEELKMYHTWFSTDGTKSEDGTNQLLLLAEKINTAAVGCYYIDEKFIKTVTEDRRWEAEIFDYYHTHIEMKKRK